MCGAQHKTSGAMLRGVPSTKGQLKPLASERYSAALSREGKAEDKMVRREEGRGEKGAEEDGECGSPAALLYTPAVSETPALQRTLP